MAQFALCYIRQSITRNKNDMLSPDRQREYINAYLAQHPELTPIWFEDAKGHRSGRSVKGRPDFQMLLDEILANPNVVRLIVTEYARVARSVFTSSQMIDLLRRRHIQLVFAYTNEEPDLQTAEGRLRLNIEAAMNEYYADYVSKLQLVQIASARAAGKWVGGRPFATVARHGRLYLTKNGAWLLPDGRLVAAKGQTTPPIEGAVFRGYADALREVYHRYASGHGGTDAIAISLNEDAWAFQDQHKQPQPFTRDDVRRILAEWPVYGGYYPMGRAKNRSGSSDPDPATIPLGGKKALLPVDLVKLVAQRRRQRALGETAGQPTPTASDHGIVHAAYPFPLAQVVRCAQCELKAQSRDNPAYRSRLGGTTQPIGRRYRHTGDKRCGLTTRSVPQAVLEDAFADLLTRLYPQTSAFACLLAEAKALDAEKQTVEPSPSTELSVALKIKRTQEKLRRLEQLYLELALSEAEYRTKKVELLAALQQLEAQPLPDTVVMLTLNEYAHVLHDPARLWLMLDAEGRRGLAHGLFDHLLFDLDTQQFTGWQLSPWAGLFFTLDKL